LNADLDARALLPPPGERSNYHMARFKRALVDQFEVEEAVRIYREMLELTDQWSAERKPIVGLRDFALRNSLHFAEIYPSGERFDIPPPTVIGPSDAQRLAGVARSFFVCCLPDAVVRERSAFIQVGDVLLLDCEGAELDSVDDQLELDPYVFHVRGREAWAIEDGCAVVELDEAFGSLIGPHSPAFGHWIWEYLPKYITALASGTLPNVPILINHGMPHTHLEALRLLVPAGTEIIVVPATTRVLVKRLWCAPTLMYAPLWEIANERYSDPNFLCFPPARFGATISAMGNCARSICPNGAEGRRLYIARDERQVRRLLNRVEIENVVRARGFDIYYPQEHSFLEQVRTIRSSSFIVGPEGSAMYSGFFASPGAKICILNHPFTHDVLTYTYLLQEVGLDVTIFTGPALRLNNEAGWPNYGHRQYADYELDERAFAEFLDEWLTIAAP
jgi:Glycosyltransferase 61